MKVESILPKPQINIISNNNLLQNLKIGDEIQAKVISINDGKFILQSSDGTSFSAISLKLSNLILGDLINLQIHGKNNGQILVNLMDKSPHLNNNQEQVIQQLIDLNIIPNKLNVDKAVFMIKNNIDMSKDSSNFLNKLIEHKGLLVDDINKLVSILTKVTDSIDKETLNILKEAIKNVILPVDEGLENKLTENKVELAKLLNFLTDSAVKLNLSSKNEVIQTINNIKGGINFSENINNIASFMQIPLNINGKETTGELYVFKDKYKKNIDSKNTSIFISLDTSNLGRIDTLIKINNKSVECTFSSQSKDVKNYIKKNVSPLYKLIEDSGYNLVKTDFKHLDKPSTILDIEIFKEPNNTITKLDIRV